MKAILIDGKTKLNFSNSEYIELIARGAINI